MVRRGPILIVDDDPGVRELIALALGRAQDVKHAGTAAEALGILRHEPAAAVVLDHRLPDRTGLEMLADIRSLQPGLPVILMTGYGSERVCAAAFKQGVWDYFPKPMDVCDLARSVRRAVGSEGVDRGMGVAGEAGPAAGAAELIGQRPDMAIQKVVQIVQHRYWDRLPLARLAVEVGMSKSRLSRRFTDVMGLSFRQYLVMVRLERAKEVLSDGQASITDVAQAVGFGDLPRFDKLFKRYTGLTPSAYRAQCVPAAAPDRDGLGLLGAATESKDPAANY